MHQRQKRAKAINEDSHQGSIASMNKTKESSPLYAPLQVMEGRFVDPAKIININL